MRTGNPALKAETFAGFNTKDYLDSEVMTLQGTTNKSYILLGLVILFAILVWNYSSFVLPFIIPIIIINLILGFIIMYKPTLSPILAPIYAITEGLFVGVISEFYNAQFYGIVIQAVSLTFGVFLSMLLLYQTKIIKPTENFKLGLLAATGGIGIIYLISFIGQITGFYNIGYIHSVGGTAGILISLFIVVIAALNLVLDFDFIESGVEARAPKYMEWYAAFGLLVTLIWLYLEILRLLSKIRD